LRFTDVIRIVRGKHLNLEVPVIVCVWCQEKVYFGFSALGLEQAPRALQIEMLVITDHDHDLARMRALPGWYRRT